MLSLPIVNTESQMGQQFSVDENGARQAVAGEFCKGDKSQLLSKAAFEGMGLVDEEITSDRPCMKDKIDNLIENYLLGSEDDVDQPDNRNKNRDFPITARSLMSDYDEDEVKSTTPENSSEIKASILPPPAITTKTENEDEIKDGEGVQKCEDTKSDKDELPKNSTVSEIDVSGIDSKQSNSSSKDKDDVVDSDSLGKKIEQSESSSEIQPKPTVKETEEPKSVTQNKNIIEPKNMTTFQTLIEKVLDTNLQNAQNSSNKSDKIEMCSKTNSDRRRSAPCSDSKSMELKSEKQNENLELGKSLSHDDMSISKRKLVFLKDHIEKVLEKSYYSYNKKQEKSDESEDSKTSDLVDENKDTEKSTNENNAVNSMSSSLKTSEEEKRVSESMPSANLQGHSHAHSSSNSMSHVPLTKSLDVSEGPQNAAMNKALIQSMARLQNHVEKAVSDISRSENSSSVKEGKLINSDYKHHPPPPPPLYVFPPKEDGAQLMMPSSVEKQFKPVSTGGWPHQIVPHQAYHGGPQGAGPPPHSNVNMVHSPNNAPMAGTYGPNVNSFYSYGAGLNQLQKPLHQSRHQMSSRQLSPRQLSPASVPMVASKTSPPNVDVGQSHIGGKANSGHQISLRDCQCVSCDSKHGRKMNPHDAANTCVRTAEYAALKPGHITSGSPYHSPNSLRPPAPNIQHRYSPDKYTPNPVTSVSSAMALGPAPPLVYYQGTTPFRMPQLYPSHPPISSPREYNRLNPQAAPVSPHGGVYPQQQAWKNTEQKTLHLSPGSAPGSQYSPNSTPHHPKHVQQRTGPAQFSPQGQSFSGKMDPYTHQEDIRHVNKDFQYPSQTEAAPPQQVSPPVLDLSIKKKHEPPSPVENEVVDSNAPLDLSCKKPKKNKMGSSLSTSPHGQSLGSYIAEAVMDKKFAAQRNAYIHQLENSVDKFCRERKSSFQRSPDGPSGPHLPERQSPKNAYNPRGQESGHGYGEGQGHETSYPHSNIPGVKIPVSTVNYPKPNVYGMPSPQMHGRRVDISPRGIGQTLEKPLHQLPPPAQQNMRNVQNSQSKVVPHHPPYQNPSPSHLHAQSPANQHSQLPQSQSQHGRQASPWQQQQQQNFPTAQQTTAVSQATPYYQTGQLAQSTPNITKQLPQANSKAPQNFPSSIPQQMPQSNLPINSQTQLSEPRSENSSPGSNDGRGKRASANVSKHEPIQNIIGNHPPTDILYLICRLCGQTYGSPYGFRKHFRNQHGFEPRAEHTVVQTISATKTALQTPQGPPPGAPNHGIQAANVLQQVPQPETTHQPFLDTSPPPLLVVQPPGQSHPRTNSPQLVPNIPKSDITDANITRDSNSLQSPGSNLSSGLGPQCAPVGANQEGNHGTATGSPVIKVENTSSGGDQEKLKVKTEAPMVSGSSPIDKKHMECPECGQTFQLNDFGLYKRHCRQHGQQKYAGPFVGADISSTYPAAEQVSSTGTPSVPAPPVSSAANNLSTVCKFCNIPFATASLLNEHMDSIHPDKMKNDLCNSSYDKPPPIIQVTRAPAESATLSVSPDSSCEPNFTKAEELEMPVLKKQVLEKMDAAKEAKTDNDLHHSTSSPTSDVNPQVSSESGSMETTEEKSSGNYVDESTFYMHKKFSTHQRKRKSSVSAMDMISTKSLKYGVDSSSAKSPGSINSPSAYSSTSYDSEASNMHEISTVNDSGDGCGEMDDSEMDKHSKLVLKIKCGNGNVANKSEARHQLPFVWDRVTRSQAGKNIKPPTYH